MAQVYEVYEVYKEVSESVNEKNLSLFFFIDMDLMKKKFTILKRK